MLRTVIADDVATRTPLASFLFSGICGLLDAEVGTDAPLVTGNFAPVFRTEITR